MGSRDGIDGWLLPFQDSKPWADAIAEVALDRRKLAERADNIEVKRTMTTVAEEMAAIYREVVQAGGSLTDPLAAGSASR